MLLLRQIAVLVWKNLLVAFVRHPVTTTLRALILPIVFSWFLSYARNFFIPASIYGIGSPTAIRDLSNAFQSSSGGRNIVAFVNNGLVGGDVDKVINQISTVATNSGKTVRLLEHETDLLTVCRSSLLGASNCFAGVVFQSSPNEGPYNVWNYTIKADGALGAKIVVTASDNDGEIYVLPLQHAIDYAIAGLNTTVNHSALPKIEEYPYTTITQAERNTQIRVRYNGAIVTILAVAFFIGICGILYQQVGAQAVEREAKMATMLEAMMPNKRRWEPQVARLASYHIAFSIIYLPGWVIQAIILHVGVFYRTNLGIVLVFNILVGLALASHSLFIAAFFRKAQLSGITSVLLALILAIIAQVYDTTSNGAVAITSLLFPSMNYVFFTVYMARFEAQNQPTELTKAAPSNPWTLPGIALWIFLIIQIIVYPILAILVEKWLYGTSSGGRKLIADDSGFTVRLNGFTKHFKPTFWETRVAPIFGKKKKEMVVAVDKLDLKVLPGQIMVLLGANGSGKSTTLDAIAGLSKVTEGTIDVDGRHGIGLCPQQNVLWKDLTVYEHVNIFNRLKATDKLATKEEKLQLIKDCDLDRKIHAKSSALSGGQMRKLQLSLMFTGGSRVCLIDECSSGVDALARRKLQDILLAERSRSNRTMIFTTHFLDEADLLSDYIVIMSKGKVKVEGTAPEIKSSLGKYRVHVYHTPGAGAAPDFPDVERNVTYDQTTYIVSESKQASGILAELETQGWKDYQISGPTIEDAFMTVAEEMIHEGQVKNEVAVIKAVGKDDTVSETKVSESGSSEKELQLMTGARISTTRQAWVLFRKRATVFRRNFFPNMAALLIPIIAAGLVTLFIKDFPGAGCNPIDQVSASTINNLANQIKYKFVLGPASKFSLESLKMIQASLPGQSVANTTLGSGNITAFTQNLTFVNTLPEFNDYISNHFHNVTPGGIFLGDDTSPAVFAYVGNSAIAIPFIVQNLMDTLLTNVSIASSYAEFDIPWQADQGRTLQFIVYLGLAISVYPGFFALYPCVERLRNVRALHYSNGIRALPLWTSYALFDFMFVILGAAISIILVRAVTSVFFGIGYLFLVLVLFGITSTLGAYVVSLFVKSQLAAFAMAAGANAVMFLLYIIAYLSTFTYSQINAIDQNLLIVHFTLSLIFPTGSLIRAMFVSLNIFSIDCRDRDFITYPGEITAYGAPILYLIVQSVLLFIFLVWYDSGSGFSLLRRKTFRVPDVDEKHQLDADVAAELERVQTNSDDGLRVLHLTKAYGKTLAVDDISFGVKRGEVFALLGPNGAGKSTTISVIRGDLKPSNNGGEVFIENIPLSKKRATARQHLGVCPQFDAMDQLTVLEHLRFYARVRGVPDVEHNVREVLRAVGLGAFANRMANSLSGGNKRKLSLGIALSGNPSVMLLDEVSSGMDVAAKRVMWRTLASIVPGRSIVLTTHSMEEADALANRAGIMAGRMLALGTSEDLRRRWGDRYHVHLLLKSAPYTGVEETERVKEWVRRSFKGVEVEDKAFHGQIRFSVPASRSSGTTTPVTTAVVTPDKKVYDSDEITPVSPLTPTLTSFSQPGNGDSSTVEGISALLATLEAAKEQVGFEYYSVSQTTLDQVFLSIVGKHEVEEEGYRNAREEGKKSWWRMGKKKSA